MYTIVLLFTVLYLIPSPKNKPKKHGLELRMESVTTVAIDASIRLIEELI